jgi:hypothetical protein
MTNAEDVPLVISFLLPEEARVWSAKEPGAVARRRIVEKAILRAARERTFSAHKKLQHLIEAEFRTISEPRADELQEMLAKAFEGRLDTAHQGALNHWRDRFTMSLLDWRQQNIFQHAKYRKLLVDCWAEAIGLARDDIESREMALFVGNAVADAFAEANRNGQAYLVSRGEPAWARHAKVRTGLANHIDATLEAASEFEREAKASARAMVISLCASSVAGLLEGTGRSEFTNDAGATITAYDLMCQAEASWGEVKSVLHLLSFSERKVPQFVSDWLTRNSLEKHLIDAVWLASRSDSVPPMAIVCPVPKRAGVAGNRIDFELVGVQEAGPQKPVLVAAFLEPVRAGKLVRDLLTEKTGGPRFGLIVVRQQLQTHDRADSTVLTQVPCLPDDAAPPTANRIADSLRHSIRVAMETGVDASVIETQNFPKDFPLEEWARLSDKYLVERPAVESFVQALLERRGLHMSCGMRRGGKTTAFHHDVLRRMQIHRGDVVVETCRSNGPLETRFFVWLQQEFAQRGELSNAALDDWFATQLGNARLFVLDEYESLFRWLVAITHDKPTARTAFVDRLLDGFVRASERWGFLFLGLEPGAARIFMADNPLTPRLQRHTFPYFQHEPGSRSSEFARLVQVVITQHLDIDSLLIDRLAYESGGHPHFAVTLLRNFVDWVLTRRHLRNRTLASASWEPFTQQRLTSLLMRQSEWFQAYRSLHEGWRADQSRWIRAMAKLAESLGDEDGGMPQVADDLTRTLNCDEDWAYTAIDDALAANILIQDETQQTVRLAVPAYGRLAAAWRRR